MICPWPKGWDKRQWRSCSAFPSCCLFLFIGSVLRGRLPAPVTYLYHSPPMTRLWFLHTSAVLLGEPDVSQVSSFLPSAYAVNHCLPYRTRGLFFVASSFFVWHLFWDGVFPAVNPVINLPGSAPHSLSAAAFVAWDPLSPVPPGSDT